ncbi:hypothetical protein MPSI1_001775 [Malassezia psittaci]|uniref:Pkinase-domain-containing protein n=1 Tax=Malassezia psittaci TaxID=1821823 RepID=A0AAF0JDL1_9BASI|nr:hypothetical protein MPSI1_001775 [Malassezia psittaci]
MAEGRNRRARLTSAYHELGQQLTSGHFSVIGNYTLQRIIGEGSFGKVRLATHRLTNSRVAVKQIPKKHVASLTREIHHHRRLHHPNVLQLYEVIQSESYIWMVTELCAGGELYDYVVDRGHLVESEARDFFGHLCLAVAYIHGRGIVHRDLKLENILLDADNRIKLSDFGFTREYEPHQFLRTRCGTTAYAAPEMLSGSRYLGPEVDIWSLGVILYVLLCGFLPFDDDNEATMQWKINNEPLYIPEHLSDESQNLLSWILQKDFSRRPTIRQILLHPWFLYGLPSASQRSSPERHRQSRSMSKPVSPNEQLFSDTVPVDFVAMLTRAAYVPFESPDEQQLIQALQGLGFAVGQIQHSVQTSACDAAGALWWLLLERVKYSYVQPIGQHVTIHHSSDASPNFESEGPMNTRRASLSHHNSGPAFWSQACSPSFEAQSLVSRHPLMLSPDASTSQLSLPPVISTVANTNERSTGQNTNQAHRHSLRSSITSWLRKDRRHSTIDELSPTYDTHDTFGAPNTEPLPTAPLPPPILPTTLTTNTASISLAPTASTRERSSSSSFHDDAPNGREVFANSQRSPIKQGDTPSLRRTSSMQRPGSAQGRRLSVSSTASGPKRESSPSLSLRTTHSESVALPSRQSSWSSVRFSESRRGSETVPYFTRLPRSPSGRINEPHPLSRQPSLRSDGGERKQPRPVSMDERAMSAFVKRASFLSDNNTVSTVRTANSSRSSQYTRVISPRVRDSLPRNRAIWTSSEAGRRKILAKKKPAKQKLDDDWVDEDEYFAGGFGQRDGPSYATVNFSSAGYVRPRRGSPCPPRTVRSAGGLAEAVMNHERPASLRGKLSRRETHTPVIEEEEP